MIIGAGIGYAFGEIVEQANGDFSFGLFKYVPAVIGAVVGGMI